MSTIFIVKLKCITVMIVVWCWIPFRQLVIHPHSRRMGGHHIVVLNCVTFMPIAQCWIPFRQVIILETQLWNVLMLHCVIELYYFNTVRLGNAFCTSEPSLVQVMPWLVACLSLPGPIMSYWQYNNFQWTRFIWKYSLKNGCHFVQASMCKHQWPGV